LLDPDQRLDNAGTGRQPVGADQDLALGVGPLRGLPTLRKCLSGRSLPQIAAFDMMEAAGTRASATKIFLLK
jgi:hypothetical protein